MIVLIIFNEFDRSTLNFQSDETEDMLLKLLSYIFVFSLRK